MYPNFKFKLATGEFAEFSAIAIVGCTYTLALQSDSEEAWSKSSMGWIYRNLNALQYKISGAYEEHDASVALEFRGKSEVACIALLYNILLHTTIPVANIESLTSKEHSLTTTFLGLTQMVADLFKTSFESMIVTIVDSVKCGGTEIATHLQQNMDFLDLLQTPEFKQFNTHAGNYILAKTTALVRTLQQCYVNAITTHQTLKQLEIST